MAKVARTLVFRSVRFGFVISGIVLASVALPLWLGEFMGNSDALAAAHSRLWYVYFLPGEVFGPRFDPGMLFASPDPRIAVIPLLVLLFLFWGMLLSAAAAIAFTFHTNTHET